MVILVITNSLQNCFFFAKIKEKGPFDGKEIIWVILVYDFTTVFSKEKKIHANSLYIM